MSALRVGVWGVGTWGEKHARVYATLPRVTFAGVHDRNLVRAREVAAQYGVEAFDTPQGLLAACDAISIAVPTVGHREAAEVTAGAGRHALVEKPMAVTVEEADAMIAAARRAGVILQVGQVERFNPAFIAAKPYVRRPMFIEAHRLAVFQPRSLDVDVVFDLMIHDLDLVLHAVGAAPESLSAVGVAVLSGNEDIANARLEFPDGCVANLTASRVSQERLRRIRFFQGDAYLSVDLFEKTGEMLRLDLSKLRPEAPLEAIRRGSLTVTAGEPLALELAAFVGSLKEGGAGAASAEEGRAALAIAAEVRSAMKRRAAQWAGRSSVAS